MKLRRFLRPALAAFTPHSPRRREVSLRDGAPGIECLEQRIAPANLVATVAGHALKIVGTDEANALTINGVAGDATAFQLTAGTGTINGGASFTTPTGVTSISIKLLGGNDTVIFSNTVAIDVKGSVTIDGGAGANVVSTTDLTVEKNLSITNGSNTAGTDNITLRNLNVKGAVKIANGDGDTDTEIVRTSVGVSAIVGSLSITNGAGQDVNTFRDENVGGSVTIKNGKPDANGIEGFTQFYNDYNTSARSFFGGNVSVSYESGRQSGSSDGLWDAEVGGNVTFDHGSGGAVATYFDSVSTSFPDLIHGSLTLKGAGAATLNIGDNNNRTGLIVDKNLSITGGAGADSVVLNKLLVLGKTNLLLGDGANTTKIDDSLFGGTFSLITGADADTFNLETNANSTAATLFGKAVLIKEGAGVDLFKRDGTSDANQAFYAYSTFVVHSGGNIGDTTSSVASHEFFPFFTPIQYIP